MLAFANNYTLSLEKKSDKTFMKNRSKKILKQCLSGRPVNVGFKLKNFTAFKIYQIVVRIQQIIVPFSIRV